MSDIVIVSGARTPMGGFQGSLSGVSAVDLGAIAIREAVARAGIAGADVEEVIMGCVLPAGLKQGPARQASRALARSPSFHSTSPKWAAISGSGCFRMASRSSSSARFGLPRRYSTQPRLSAM